MKIEKMKIRSSCEKMVINNFHNFKGMMEQNNMILIKCTENVNFPLKFQTVVEGW